MFLRSRRDEPDLKRSVEERTGRKNSYTVYVGAKTNVDIAHAFRI